MMDYLKKIWKFIWYEDSFASFMVNIILAFLIVKFLLYPGLGLVIGTKYPIVAVVSSSMEHNDNFDNWWNSNKEWYLDKGITKEDFQTFKLNNGFNKGDIVFLYGTKNPKVGDVIVFQGSMKYPIIHRIVNINEDGTFQTKGDNNPDSRQDEMSTPIENVYGKSYFRLPWFGWVKITAVCGLNSILSDTVSFNTCMKRDI